MIRNLLLGAALTVGASGAAAQDRLLVGNKSADTVWILDAGTGARLAEIPTGAGPHEIATSADGRMAVVTNYGGEAAGDSLTVIDLAQGGTRGVALGVHGRPHGLRLLPGDEAAIVTAEQTGTLLRVDIARGVVDGVVEVGDGLGHMVALSRDGRHAYVSKLRAGTVSRVDLDRMEVVTEQPAGAGSEGIAVASDGRVWVGNRAADTVTVHDPDSLAILAKLPSEGFPIRVVFTPDGRHALVTNARAATLAVFDVVTHEQVATVALTPPDVEVQSTMLGTGALPIGAIVHPGGGRAFVAMSGLDRIAVIETTHWQVIDWWPTGREPDALGIVEAAGR